MDFTAVSQDPFFSDYRVWGSLVAVIISIFLFVGFAIVNIDNKVENEKIQPILSSAQKARLSEWDSVESSPMKVIQKKEVNLKEDNENDSSSSSSSSSRWDLVESSPMKVIQKKEVNLKEDNENDSNSSSSSSSSTSTSDSCGNGEDELPELIPSDAPNVDKEAIEVAINKAVKETRQEGEEGLTKMLERVKYDEKIKAFIDGNNAINSPTIEMFARMYENGKDLMASGSTQEADAIYQISKQGFAMHHALAATLLSNKHPNEAVRMYARVVNARTSALGDTHVDTLSSLMGLAGAFRQLQMRAECKALYTRALRGYEEQLGAEHPFTLRCVNNLAAIFCEESKFSEAKDLFEQVLEKQEAEFGTDHKDTIVTVGNLAVVNEQLDNYEEARIFFERAILGNHKNHGTEHPATISITVGFAGFLSKHGKYSEAKGLFEVVLEAHRKKFGESHPSTLMILFNIGGLLKQEGKFDEGRRMLERARAGFEQALGSDHDYTKLAANAISDCDESTSMDVMKKGDDDDITFEQNNEAF